MTISKRKRSPEQIKAIFAKFGKLFSKRLKRRRVSSSNIHSIGYEPENKSLEVKFKSKSVYRYSNVPESTYRKFMTASSKGKFFHKKIRNAGYPFEKLK